jgi:hypothetical protein
MAYWKIINNNIYLCENKRVKKENGKSKIQRNIIFKAGHIDSLDDIILDKLQELKGFIQKKRKDNIR